MQLLRYILPKYFLRDKDKCSIPDEVSVFITQLPLIINKTQNYLVPMKIVDFIPNLYKQTLMPKSLKPL